MVGNDVRNSLGRLAEGGQRFKCCFALLQNVDRLELSKNCFKQTACYGGRLLPGTVLPNGCTDYEMMKKLTQANAVEELYNNIFFYQIPLENDDLVLTKEVLTKHLSPAVKVDRAMNKLHNEFLSYRAGVICIALKDSESINYKIYMGVEGNNLYVGCQCGMPESLLCQHAYHGFMTFIDRKKGELKPYFWPGYEPDTNGGNKFLDIEVKWHDIRIRPKIEFGNLFIPNQGFLREKQIIFDSKRSKLSKKQQDAKVLGFNILYNVHRSSYSVLPFLLPFTAKTKKNDSTIHAYDVYIWEDSIIPAGIDLTSNQRELISLSHQMYKIAYAMQGTSFEEYYPDNFQVAIADMLQLWQTAVPLLKMEPYLRCSFVRNLKYMEGKPKKNLVGECGIDQGTVKITFILTEQEDHYTLEPSITAIDKNISKDYLKFSLFAMDTLDMRKYHLHLMDNLQDDAILEWFFSGGHKLTVLKENFNEFRSRLLDRLGEFYDIDFLPFKSRKKHDWNQISGIYTID